MNWELWKCRCSAISKIMANSRDNPPITEIQKKRLCELEDKAMGGTITPKQKEEMAVLALKEENSRNVILSDSCIAYLVEAYAWETEKMVSVTKEMDVEYFERGNKTESESIKLLREVDKVDYVKNEQRFENDFLSGIPDLIDVKEMIGETGPVFYASAIRDIKSTKDYPTFLYKIHKGLDPGNKEQLQGYGDIFECRDLSVAFTLPTMPESIRNGYSFRLAMKMDAATTDSPEFKKAWAELERSMIFDRLPASKRVYKVPVDPFTSNEQGAVYDRVKAAREWLYNFNEMYHQLNK